MPRERTKSTREEFNVSSYVDSCTDFKSNVTCQPLNSFTAFPASATAITLLLVPEEGSRLTLAKPSVWTAELDTAVARATEGTAYATDVAGHRVLVGLLPKKASRYNSALRPDVISTHVSTASGAKGFTSVHVVPCFAESDVHAVALVGAVARAVKRSFSAKGGKAERSYYEPATPTTVYFAGNQQSQMNTLAFSTQLCMRLVDAPTNLLDTTTYPEIAEFYAKKLGFEFKVIRGEELREKGYGGLYGVGKAAEFPPALVQLTYRPQGGIAPKDKIAFVGKGIVYDTGGLSIKTPGTGMCTMKMDMGGSAAVFTGFLALVMEKAPYAIDCILCLADNAISARAQRNDDIVIMKSGKTVEINNTDAEGRLVLGDGVNHAATETGAAPSLILDMATLTGAQGISTGKWHAGLFTNSAEWEAKVMAAGLRSGDMCFPLLYAPEFHLPEFSSKVADMRNSVKNRSNAQSSCAAAFIEDNLPKDYAGAYVHLDIAFPAARDEAATGYGPAILWTLFSA